MKNINSIDEAKIYLKAGLKEAMVGGRHALIRSDIDWSAFNCRKEWLKAKLSDWDRWKDYNNADLIGEGYPPRDSNGDPYELHHIGQRQDSPFAELSWSEHMGDGNNTILHRMGEYSVIDLNGVVQRGYDLDFHSRFDVDAVAAFAAFGSYSVKCHCQYSFIIEKPRTSVIAISRKSSSIPHRRTS